MEGAWVALALTLKVAGWATAINLVFGVAVGYALAVVYPAAGNLGGQVFAVFVIVVAAAEVAVALAIVLTLYRLRRTPNLDEADILKG